MLWRATPSADAARCPPGGDLSRVSAVSLEDDVSANHGHHHAAGANLLMGCGENIAVQHLKISDFADLYRSAYRFFPFLIAALMVYIRTPSATLLPVPGE